MNLTGLTEAVANEVARVRYAEGQFLGASDFRAEQLYHRLAMRRHQLGPHTWGIVTGFELVEETDGEFVDAFVQPGFAIDGYGRHVVSFARTPVDVGLFAFAAGGTALFEVWLAYDEDDTGRAANDLCDDGFATRTIESWRLVIEPLSTDGGVTIDGASAVIAAPGTDPRVMPVDRAVPHQEFPLERPVPTWMIRLGSLRWDASVQRFRPAGSASLVLGRTYAGAVAQHVLSPSDALPRRSS